MSLSSLIADPDAQLMVVNGLYALSMTVPFIPMAVINQHKKNMKLRLATALVAAGMVVALGFASQTVNITPTYDNVVHAQGVSTLAATATPYQPSIATPTLMPIATTQNMDTILADYNPAATIPEQIAYFRANPLFANERKLNEQQLRFVMELVGFPAQNADMWLRIAACESGGHQFPVDTRAYNGRGRDHSLGVFQINMIGDIGIERREIYNITNEDLYNVAINALVALDISGGGYNIGPWGCKHYIN